MAKAALILIINSFPTKTMPTVAPPISVFFAITYSSHIIAIRSIKGDIWILLQSILQLHLSKNIWFLLHNFLLQIRLLLSRQLIVPVALVCKLCNYLLQLIMQEYLQLFHILPKISTCNFFPVKFAEPNFQVTILYTSTRKSGILKQSMTVHRHHQRPQLFATLKMSRIENVQNKFVFGIPNSNILIRIINPMHIPWK